MKRFDEIPMMPGANLLGHIHAFETDRLPFLRRIGETGPLVRTRFVNRELVFVNTPETAHELLVENARACEKSPGIRLLLRALAGEGLFTSEGELWRRQRRLMAPLFQPSAIGEYARSVNEVTRRAVASWGDGARVDLSREMTRVTMGVVGKALFDADAFDDSDEVGAALTQCLQWVDDQSASPALVLQIALVEAADAAKGRIPTSLEGARAAVAERLKEPFLVPGSRSPALREAVARLDRKIQQMIDERRAQGFTRNDLLTRLLSARDDGKVAMTDRQVRDEATTIFVAGHETTATSLAWAFYLLSRNPEARARVQAEADAFGPEGPTSFDGAGLEYTLRVFKETARLYPPLLVFARRALEAFTLGGHEMPAGTIFFVSPWAIHRDPKVFPDPERFDPDRFLPEAEASRHRAAWVPFGLGPRVCIGNHFAMMEAPMVMATVMRQARVEVDPSRDVVPEPFATLRPGGGVHATVRRRAD